MVDENRKLIERSIGDYNEMILLSQSHGMGLGTGTPFTLEVLYIFYFLCNFGWLIAMVNFPSTPSMDGFH